MYIDSHAHINFKEYEGQIKDVLERSFQAGVKKIVDVGSNYKTSVKTLEILKQVQNDNSKIKMYSAIGCHPIHLVKDITESATFDGKEYKFTTKKEFFDKDKYQKLIDENNEYIVAIGETGLDYFRIEDKSHLQKKIFKKHIELALDNDLPLILHCRGSEDKPYEAYDEMIEILQSYCHPELVSGSTEIPDKVRNDSNLTGVAHCFVGNLNQAQELIKMGFYIGVNGIVTFKNAKEVQEVVKQIPLEKILLETDCPFLAPDPYRGKRNEPMYIPEIAKKIADLKSVSLEEVEKKTTKNSEKLFSI